MIHEIKRRLDNRETVRLLCVDEIGFIEEGIRSGGLDFKNTILKSDIVVDSVHGLGGPCPTLFIKDRQGNNCCYNILMEDLKYFKIKE